MTTFTPLRTSEPDARAPKATPRVSRSKAGAKPKYSRDSKPTGRDYVMGRATSTCWLCEGPVCKVGRVYEKGSSIGERVEIPPILYYEPPHKGPNPRFCSRSCRAEWRRLRVVVGEA